jgi:hypothetical protein
LLFLAGVSCPVKPIQACQRGAPLATRTIFCPVALPPLSSRPRTTHLEPTTSPWLVRNKQRGSSPEVDGVDAI